jgi:hypothetical protein
MVHTQDGFVDKFLADLSAAAAFLLANPGHKACRVLSSTHLSRFFAGQG